MRGAGIEGADLRKIPVALQVHDVVVELDVGVQNLASARIGHVRSYRVLDGRGQPEDYGIAHVLGTPVGILLRGRSILANDGVAESSGFESGLPLLDAFLYPRLPLLGCGGIHAIDDRLPPIGNTGGGLLLFQTPARDEFAVRSSLPVS